MPGRGPALSEGCRRALGWLGLASLAAIGALAVLAGGGDADRPRAVAALEHGARRAEQAGPPRRPGEFRVDGLSIRVAEAGEITEIRADRVDGRHRTGRSGAIVYYDLLDIHAAAVDVRVRSPRDDDAAALSKVFDAGHRVLSSFAPASARSLDVSDPNLHMTRLVLWDAAIGFEGPGGDLLSVSAPRGRLGLDSRTLVLEGGVEVATRRGERIEAFRAVFSDRFEGVFLPDGGTAAGRDLEGEALLRLDDQGVLARVTPAPEIDYADYVTERERIVINHYLKKAPPALRTLLAAALGSLQQSSGR